MICINRYTVYHIQYFSITSVDVGNTMAPSWWARASFAQKTMVFSAIGIATIITVFIIACLIAQKIRIGFYFRSPFVRTLPKINYKIDFVVLMSF